ncbi:MAG: hypothetical protein LAO03_12695 [Acidobacteriia bacterium]|nr:hypothetical protein [Terriglobia bacterium]
MKKFAVRAIILAVLLAAVAYAHGEESWTFRGQIADSQCALNVHSLTRSHQEMLKSKSMGGTASSCTLYCLRYMGGYLVLTSRKHVYRLDDQEAAKNFVGQKVRISGTLEPKTDVIHISKIEAEE